ncbi:MAG TPA: NAD-binding protein [Pirellulales bacterium]|nr:NAD-binding protein [Pirellulales bacterium]
MAIDTPARIVIIGAGPIGLEAALYARYLGYEVAVYDRGAVGEHIRRWGHVPMFTPWKANVTPLGLAALRAQDDAWQLPGADDLPTGVEFLERYVAPLAASDLLSDGIYQQTAVVAVAKQSLLKGELAGDPARGDENFRVLLRTADGNERYDEADAVIDCSGTFGRHAALGAGGLPAIGEAAVADVIEYGIPDVLGAARNLYAGAHVLVVGAGHSAATTVVALAGLEPRPNVTWLTRREPAVTEGPVRSIANDPLAQRERLVREANRLAANVDPAVRHLPGTRIEAIHRDPQRNGSLRVTVAGLTSDTITVDRIIANVGYRPDGSIFSELQVGPSGTTDGLADPTGGPPSLLTGEPNFYVLGAKSFGRNSHFLLSDGHRQIRDLFTIVGDRAALDLYRTMPAWA